MKSTLLSGFLIVALSGFCQKLAITLDDAPFGASYGMSDKEKVEVFQNLLDALDKHQIKATFFVTTGNLTLGNQAILNMAKAAGHQLGNHTHGHLNLNNVTAREYSMDIDLCSEKAKEWINSKYFRYSYLRRGDTAEKRDSVLSHLEKRNLILVPVTIDNSEWEYNRDYGRALAKKDTATMNSQLQGYLDHMSEFSERYRKMGLELMDREIAHILLIHVNPLNCDHLDKLLDQYKRAGWEFVSLDEAMEDEFYSLPEHYIGPHGISQLDRIKRSK